MTSRHWCFTLYGTPQPFLGATELPVGVRYVIYQREKCPDTGRHHWQGYVEFTTPVRLARARRTIGGAPHCEPRRGSREEAREYCRKLDSRCEGHDPIELGTWITGQGARTDIAAAVDIVRSSPSPAGLQLLYDTHPTIMVKYSRGMANALHHYAGRVGRDNPPSVYVHYGNTGTGKTYTVYDRHSLQDVWRAPVSTNNIQWFDGYLGHNIALFDDFDGHHPAITVMLQILDRYPVQVPIKGAHTHFVPEIIYITTNIPFEQWYPDATDVHKAALKRRITEFIRFRYLDGNQSPPGSSEPMDREGDGAPT